MSIRSSILALASACVLAACGGGEPTLATGGETQSRASTAPAAAVKVFAGVRSSYIISANGAGGYTVVDLANGGASTTVEAGVKRLRFADSTLGLDIDGIPGIAYRLYKAAFNRIPDSQGLGYWIDVMENGLSRVEVAGHFQNSEEYRGHYGADPTPEGVISRYYRNVLGREGEAGGMAFWTGILARDPKMASTVLADFSESPENKAGVAALIRSGIVFTEPGINYTPVANAGADIKTGPYKTITLDGRASTVSFGRTISFAWTITSRPLESTAALTGAATAQPSFTPDIPGIYELSLTVSDGSTSSRPARLVVDTSLWQAPESAVPASGNFVYLQSQPGDYVGGGRSHLYTSANSVITLVDGGRMVNLQVRGDEDWDGQFTAMTSATRLQRGWYSDLGRYPFHNPAKGGLSVGGEGRGCNQLKGWFLVDSVTYDGDKLTSIDLRFEQHCEGAGPALNGRIRWSGNEASTVAGPVNPPPLGLWQPGTGKMPASGNAIYLESSATDYIGAGRSYNYSDASAIIKVGRAQYGNGIDISVDGDENWHASYGPMNSLSRLEAGYYSGVQRYPFNNPVRGGMDWSGEGRGCNTLTGWFVVDSVSYDGDTLKALDLRFEQHCEGGSSTLRGRIRWSAADVINAPGPVAAPPGLWEPALGATPASGNYVYLDSSAGDFIGRGLRYTYTHADAVLGVQQRYGAVTVNVSGDQDWSGEFMPMNSLAMLAPGYYGGLQRYPFHNPAKGGLSWSGEGRGCNTLAGWFMVDKVRYESGNLVELDLRFEQRCDGMPPLRGKVHWSAAAVPVSALRGPKVF